MQSTDRDSDTEASRIGNSDSDAQFRCQQFGATDAVERSRIGHNSFYTEIVTCEYYKNTRLLLNFRKRP